MSIYMARKHKHRKHKMVKLILLKIAKEQSKDFAEIKMLFTQACDPNITSRFWQILRTRYPDHKYIEVSHCPGCGKFDLE